MAIFRDINASGEDLIQIHIPRTGGSYIFQKLNAYTRDELKRIPHLHDVKQHYTLQQIQSYYEIKINETLIFSTIRNPISRTLSTYHFFKSVNKSSFPDLDEFIDLIEDVMNAKKYDDPKLIHDFLYNKKMDINHFRPQVEYIKSEVLNVNLFKLEDGIEDLVDMIHQRFSIDLSGLRCPKNRMDQLNPDQLQRLKNLYLEDLEFFGYQN